MLHRSFKLTAERGSLAQAGGLGKRTDLFAGREEPKAFRLAMPASDLSSRIVQDVLHRYMIPMKLNLHLSCLFPVCLHLSLRSCRREELEV